MTGTIARLKDTGFGFIKPAEGDRDIFFHANSLQGVTFEELNEGDAVTFDVEQTEKGPNATNVARAAAGAASASDEEAA